MEKQKKIDKVKTKIPNEQVKALQDTLISLGDPDLGFYIRGPFAYITHDDTPLCRLEYCGKPDEWTFALYKYSRGKYSTDLPLLSGQGTATSLVRQAMHIYNLIE